MCKSNIDNSTKSAASSEGSECDGNFVGVSFNDFNIGEYCSEDDAY